MDITMIIQGIILILVGAFGVGITMLKIKMAPSDFDKLVQLATVGVYAVEQIYKTFDGEDVVRKKFDEVKLWLKKQNLKVSDEDIIMAIEAAVKKMKVDL